MEYIILEKEKKEFQMVLNQWKHKYDFEILWMEYNGQFDSYYRALIKRWEREFI